MNLSPGLWTPVAHGRTYKVNITTINSATNIRQNKHSEVSHPKCQLDSENCLIYLRQKYQIGKNLLFNFVTFNLINACM